MEPVIFDETPLAAYLRDEGEDRPADWVPAVESPSADACPVTPDSQDKKTPPQTQQPTVRVDNGVDTPPPSPPSPSFAPVGQPMVRKRFRNKIPNPLRVDSSSSSSRRGSLSGFNKRYSVGGLSPVPVRTRSLSRPLPPASPPFSPSTSSTSTSTDKRPLQRVVASTINRADNAQFLEQFRYTIITSHLLGPSAVGHGPQQPQPVQGPIALQLQIPSADQAPGLPGLVAAVSCAFVLAWSVSWFCTGGFVHLTKKRVVFGLVLLAVVSAVGHVVMRQQRIRYTRQSALSETRTFVTRSQDFDSAASAAISFIKEVELVSRGYRLSAPLPPISRMDDRSQTRRCMRLRKAVRGCFGDLLPLYKQTVGVIQGFAEQLELEMYYHIYDVSDLDISDAMQAPPPETEFEDLDALRSLNIVAARFHTIRRMLLCELLALEANGDESDLVRWTAACDGLHALNEATGPCFTRLQTILGEVESFPQVATPKVPLSPNRERWRSQLGKLNSLSTGIRGLQAKLALLREESDRTLNEADDITQLGPNLMAQYESIGQDIKMLIQAWEEGKSALASGIDRNEKRLSSIGTLMSPSISLSGLTTVGEEEGGGGAEDALRALTGGGASPLDGSTVGDPEEEVVFEAISLPPVRPKSMLTRDERIAKMREDRERRAEAREQSDANRGMLRELEMVINLRPRPKAGRFSAPAAPSSGRSSL